MSVRVPRRRFIGTLASPAIASVLSACRPKLPAPKPIVIVGAGLAGLRAADLIKSDGGQVIVLEARERPGGRVRTIREQFAEGLHAEAGAARVANTHARVMRLAARFNLGLMPFNPSTGVPLVSVRGLGPWRIPGDLDDVARALGLTRDERLLTPAALTRRYVGDLPAALSVATPITPDLLDTWKPYDDRSWPEWLKVRGASDGAIALMTAGGDSSRLSALYVLRQMALLGTTVEFYTIEGGMDRLVRALSHRLTENVRYQSAVTRVEHSRDGVTVQYLSGGRAISINASRVVFTNPLSTLEAISVHPELAQDTARAVADVPYYPATRLIMETRRRFWERAGLSGTARTDDPAEIWDAAPDAQQCGLLSATLGRDLAAADSLGASPLRVGVRLAGRVFGQLPRELVKGASVAWLTEPWSRGAFAAFEPGQMTTYVPRLGVPQGRLHFAGEHTSAWTGWMEGALESAERVAAEVLR